MDKRNSLHPDRDVQHLESQYGVIFTERTIRRVGFSGQEQITLIAEFIITATAAGLFKKIGEEIWSQLRDILQRRFKTRNAAPNHNEVIEIRVAVSDRNIAFVFRAQHAPDILTLSTFGDAIRLELVRNPELKGFSHAEYELSIRGNWDHKLNSDSEPRDA